MRRENDGRGKRQGAETYGIKAWIVNNGWEERKRMPRKAGLDAPGTLHNVIIRRIERRPIVDDEKDRENFVSRLGHLAAETENRLEIL